MSNGPLSISNILRQPCFAGDENNILFINKIPRQTTTPETKIEPIRQTLLGLSQPFVSGETHLAFYAGPKERLQLAESYDGFQRLIDYGFFGIIAEPLAAFMTFLYANVASNYGVVIIILTILIKFCFIR
jgi:membrane protein insertase Oxa1/YidC/SpoIIIJ